MIEFTTSFSYDYGLEWCLKDWVEKSNVEYKCTVVNGCVKHRMHADDFQDFLHEYFNIKVDV